MSIRPIRSLSVVGMFLAPLAVQAQSAQITGVVTYRERIALPPSARFEATVEDAERAGAPSTVLVRTVIQGSLGPLFRFAIPYDPASLDPRAR